MENTIHQIQTLVEIEINPAPPPDLLGTDGWKIGTPSMALLEAGKGYKVIFPYTTQYTGDITDLTPHAQVYISDEELDRERRLKMEENILSLPKLTSKQFGIIEQTLEAFGHHMPLSSDGQMFCFCSNSDTEAVTKAHTPRCKDIDKAYRAINKPDPDSTA